MTRSAGSLKLKPSRQPPTHLPAALPALSPAGPACPESPQELTELQAASQPTGQPAGARSAVQTRDHGRRGPDLGLAAGKKSF